MVLSDPVHVIKGIGPKKASLCQRLSINTLQMHWNVIRETMKTGRTFNQLRRCRKGKTPASARW